MEELERRLEATLSLVIGWLRYAEAKNGVAVALCGGAVAAIGSEILRGNPKPCCLLMALEIAMGTFTLAALFALSSFLPILNIEKALNIRAAKPKEADNLLFFENIRKYSGPHYLKSICEHYFSSIALDEGSRHRLTDIANQTVAIAAIASRKMLISKISVAVAMLGFLLILAAEIGILIWPLP